MVGGDGISVIRELVMVIPAAGLRARRFNLEFEEWRSVDELGLS